MAKSDSADTFKHVLTQAIKTFEERNAVYQDGWVRHGEAMKAFFPTGLRLDSPDDFARFLLFEMCVSKLNRYAANFFEGGHKDSAHDLGVYAFMMEVFDEQLLKKGKKDD